MKKVFLFLLIAFIVVGLSACGAANANTGLQANGTPQARGDQPLSPAAQLAVGTMKLQGTNLAVTKDLAPQLLPLWQMYKQLSSSNTAAKAEIDAVVQQIHDTMTADQIKAIDNMHLTQQAMMEFLQQSGFLPTRSGTPFARQSGNGNFPGGPGGGPPEGGFPGGQGGNGQNISPEQRATFQAMRNSSNQFGSDIPRSLLNALIVMLQKLIPGSISATPEPPMAPPSGPIDVTPAPDLTATP